MSLSRPRRGREDEEGDGGDQGQRESTPGKRLRRCACCQETEDFYERQFEILKKEMQRMSKGFVKKQQREMKASQLQLKEEICKGVGQLVREQLSTFISELSTPGDTHLRNYRSLRAIPNQNQTRTYRLKFENKYCNVKYSRHDITADDGSPIKVAIYDHDDRIITDGPLSSIKVKIVVLNGEFNNDNKEQWSRISFCDNIIESRPGKQPLFSNGHYLTLENGVATLCGAKFQDNSSFLPTRKVRMGVMAADDSMSAKIMEGISDCFFVKDGRGYGNKKDHRPSLNDPIYKLKKIGKNGDRRKLLEQMQIKLVQDFVRFYKKDKDGLRKACRDINISDHDWDIIVTHALSCKPGHERYSYRIPDMHATIFFDSVYSIVGGEFRGKYSSYEELDNFQKGLVKEFKMNAYDNLRVVQHEDKKNCYEHECNYSRGSCSNLSLPALPTKIHDEIPQQGTGLESGPAQESPRPRQRWMKIGAKIGIMVTTVQLLKKKPSTESSLGRTDTFAGLEVLTGSEMYAAPFTEDSLGMADTFNPSQVVPLPETEYAGELRFPFVVSLNRSSSWMKFRMPHQNQVVDPFQRLITYPESCGGLAAMMQREVPKFMCMRSFALGVAPAFRISSAPVILVDPQKKFAYADLAVYYAC